MKKHFISDGISGDSVKKMLRCFEPQFRRYKQGETVMRYSDKIDKIGLMRTGSAQLQFIDAEGNCGLLETYEEKNIFGELFHLSLESFEYIVEAMTDCEVIFIDYQHIITPCEKTCSHHSQLINNLFLMTAERSQAQSLHLSILNQPNIRKKLLAYLRYIRSISASNPFTIPMTLSALAKYLCVDRSAMTREIHQMNAEGIIKSNRKEFFLYSQNATNSTLVL